MTRLPRHRRSLGSVYSAALLLLTLLITGACGTGTYNDRMERRIQQLKSSAAEQPEESDEAAADVPPADEEEELLEDEVPEVNEPID